MPLHATAQPSVATSPVISDLAISLYFCSIIAVIVSGAGDESRVFYMLDKCTVTMPQPLSTLHSWGLICFIFLALCSLSSLFWEVCELREYLAIFLCYHHDTKTISDMLINFYSCKYLFILIFYIILCVYVKCLCVLVSVQECFSMCVFGDPSSIAGVCCSPHYLLRQDLC